MPWSTPRLAAGDWAGALALLKDRPDASPEQLARCYEGLTRWTDAARARVAAGQPEAALAAFRRAGALGEAAALAETVGQKDEAALLKTLSPRCSTAWSDWAGRT